MEKSLLSGGKLLSTEVFSVLRGLWGGRSSELHFFQNAPGDQGCNIKTMRSLKMPFSTNRKEINIPVDLNGTITIPKDFDEPLSMSIYGGGIVIAKMHLFQQQTSG